MLPSQAAPTEYQLCSEKASHIRCEYAHAGSPDAALMARTQLYTIRTTVDVPKSSLGSTTSEVLSLRLRDAFYDSLGSTLPGISSSPDLVLDTLPSKPLVMDCSLHASLVPSLAEVLMLSKALTTAVAAACQKLGCLQYGYTLLLNKHTVLVKDLSAAQATLRSTTVAPATPSPGPQVSGFNAFQGMLACIQLLQM